MFTILTDAQIYDEVVQRGLRRARASVWIATANVKDFFLALDTHTGSILELIEGLCDRKVEVRLLHSGLPSGPFRADYRRRRRYLPPRYFAMRRCPRVHFKTVILDGERAYLGSANFTGAGLGMKSAGRRNFELGVVTAAPAAVDQLADYFFWVWDGGACRSCRQKKYCPRPLAGPLDD